MITTNYNPDVLSCLAKWSNEEMLVYKCFTQRAQRESSRKGRRESSRKDREGLAYFAGALCSLREKKHDK